MKLILIMFLFIAYILATSYKTFSSVQPKFFFSLLLNEGLYVVLTKVHGNKVNKNRSLLFKL